MSLGEKGSFSSIDQLIFQGQLPFSASFPIFPLQGAASHTSLLRPHLPWANPRSAPGPEPPSPRSTARALPPPRRDWGVMLSCRITLSISSSCRGPWQTPIKNWTHRKPPPFAVQSLRCKNGVAVSWRSQFCRAVCRSPARCGAGVPPPAAEGTGAVLPCNTLGRKRTRNGEVLGYCGSAGDRSTPEQTTADSGTETATWHRSRRQDEF